MPYNLIFVRLLGEILVLRQVVYKLWSEVGGGGHSTRLGRDGHSMLNHT